MDDWAGAARSVARGIRLRVLRLAAARNGAYLAQACSSADILAALYVRLMDLAPSEGAWLPPTFRSVPRPGLPSDWGGQYNGPRECHRDRFILSPAHYATALYAALIEAGRLSETALDDCGRDGSRLEMIGAEYSPGVEATTGSLAQGLSVAIGEALARRVLGLPGTFWVLMSDGELQEGQTWEALMAAAHHRLGNLVVLLDANGLQVDGAPETVMGLEPIADKISAFGWSTEEVDGHDVEAIVAACTHREPNRPLFIICRTKPWTGITALASRYPSHLHFVRFRPGEAAAAARDISVELAELVK